MWQKTTTSGKLHDMHAACKLKPRPHARIRVYFWIRNLFFPDTASHHTHLTSFTTNPDIFKSALQSGKNKSSTVPITCGRVNPDIFESDDVASSCPVSYRTFHQHGGNNINNRAHFPPLSRALWRMLWTHFIAIHSSTLCTWVNAYTTDACGQANSNLVTLRADETIFESGKKKCLFKNIRIRVVLRKS